MAIWTNPKLTLDELNISTENTLAAHLQMEFVDIGDNFLKMKMPVNSQVHQPYGLLHGGASAALAETIGSVASWMCINRTKQLCVGIEINCNHIKSVKSGYVFALAQPLHIGASSHVWDIKITDEKDRLICVSRLTVAILNPKNQAHIHAS